jgi:transcription elongation factor Elf1
VKRNRINKLPKKVFYQCPRCKIISVVTTGLNTVVCGMCRQFVALEANLSTEEAYRRLWE